MTTATDYLRRAADIMDERGKQYDKPEGERSMGKCVAAFNIVTGRDLTEAEGWLLLQILKDVRAKAAAIEPGTPGDCDLCGEWSARLIRGACAPCRDRYKLP